MQAQQEISPRVNDARERIIVALDVDSEAQALAIAAELRGSVGAFKIGLQLYAAAGPRFVRELVEEGYKIFLDLKFHDIPTTVAKASVEAARLGVWMFNLHASGGREMMLQARDAVDEISSTEGSYRPLIIGVTVLTSSDDNSLAETGVGSNVKSQVERLARLAYESGMDGVVASPREVELIRSAVPSKDFLTVTPGIRHSDATVDDQKRVTTVGRALANGSDYIVIGRPITEAPDRAGAVARMLEEVSSR